MSSKEQAIKEKRLIEATKKNMMGSAGKPANIAKYLGEEIRRQGSFYIETTYLEDFEPKEEEIPYFSGNEDSGMMGYTFSGLQRGMHLEINYMFELKSIEIIYKGYSVYKETSGELEGYAPFSDWEDLVEKLYKQACTRKELLKKSFAEVEKEEIKREQVSFLKKLRMLWGI